MTDFRFEPEGHRYFLGAERIPGVTEILSDMGITDLSMVRRELLEYKAAFGISGHEVTSKWDQGILDITSLNPVHLPTLEAWIQFRRDFGFEPIAIEYESYSSKWKYGFRIDRIGRIGKGKFADKIAVADIKTGTYSDGVRYQLGGYQEGWNELGTDKATVRLCIQLKDGKYKVYPFTGGSDVRDFLTLLQAWKIKHRR